MNAEERLAMLDGIAQKEKIKLLQMEEQEFLRWVVIKSGTWKLCLIAIDNMDPMIVKNKKAVVKVAEKTDYRHAEFLFKKIKNQEFARYAVLNSDSLDVRLAAIKSLDPRIGQNQETFVRVLMKEKSPRVLAEAIKRIDDPNILASFMISRPKDAETACEAWPELRDLDGIKNAEQINNKRLLTLAPSNTKSFLERFKEGWARFRALLTDEQPAIEQIPPSTRAIMNMDSMAEQFANEVIDKSGGAPIELQVVKSQEFNIACDKITDRVKNILQVLQDMEREIPDGNKPKLAQIKKDVLKNYYKLTHDDDITAMTFRPLMDAIPAKASAMFTRLYFAGISMMRTSDYFVKSPDMDVAIKETILDELDGKTLGKNRQTDESRVQVNYPEGPLHY